MNKKEDSCILWLFLQCLKPVWELVLKGALLRPAFEQRTLLEKECSSLYPIFNRVSSGRYSQA